MKSFPAFWFEGNLSFGWVRSREDLLVVVKRYNTYPEDALRRHGHLSHLAVNQVLDAKSKHHKFFEILAIPFIQYIN